MQMGVTGNIAGPLFIVAQSRNRIGILPNTVNGLGSHSPHWLQAVFVDGKTQALGAASASFMASTAAQSSVSASGAQTYRTLIR